MHHAHLDKLAYQDSWVHRLDSRTKLLVTVLFTLVVIALPRTSPTVLFVAMIGPFTVLVLGGIPLRFVTKHILWICPLMLVLALSCVWFDRGDVTYNLGPWVWHTTRGWLRALTLVGKFTVTMTALIALVSTTRFNDLLVGLQQLHVPQVLVIQLGFLYRYLFVLIDSAHHLLRARNLRRLRSLRWRHELRVAAALVGSLLTRSLTTAERTSRAMEVRGFNGHWTVTHGTRWRWAEGVFLVAGLVYLGLLLCAVPWMQPGGTP